MNKKYVVDYCSGSTGYGWRKEYDRLEDFEDLINQTRREYTASLWVWDESVQGFIFWKDCLDYKPRIDKLIDPFRDRRTLSKQCKREEARI
jgi:hypothetical protein